MKIIKAAIRFKDKIYEGFDHGECFRQMEKEGIKSNGNEEQGFLTDESYEFVDRKTAYQIARDAGQITYDAGEHPLISEDLHLYWLNEQEKKIKEQEVEIINDSYKIYKLKLEIKFLPTDIINDINKEISKYNYISTTYVRENIMPKLLKRYGNE